MNINKLRYGFLTILTLVLTLSLSSCEEDGFIEVENAPSGISFDILEETITIDQDGTLLEDGSASYQLKMQATVPTTEDRTFTVTVDPTSTTAVAGEYTLESSTITISAGETIGYTNVTFDYAQIPLGVTRVLAFEMETEDVDYVVNTSRTSSTISYSAYCPNNVVSLDIVFDGYASETSISVVDADGNTYIDIAQGTWADGDASYSTSLCLPAGTFTVTIGDSYEDGLSYPDDGSVTLSSSDGTVLYTVSGNFGASASGSFTLD